MRKLLSIILLSLLSVLLISCSSKKQTPLKQPQIKEVEVEKIEKTYILKNLTTDLKINCMAVVIDDNETKANNYISINHYENYLKIELNTKNDFPNNYFRLSSEAKDKLSCIAPIIQKEKGLIVQILGYANPDEQHLADNRAISVAELLFNQGVRAEIYAKGCLKKESSSIGLSIFLYTNDLPLKNNCKLN